MLRVAAIAYGAMNSVETFASHPQLRRAPPVTLENGEIAHLVAAPPVQHSFEPDAPRFGRVPALGEHSAAIRAEFAAQKAIAS